MVLRSASTKIEDETFFNCKSLESIIIPTCVTEIGKNAFCGCEKLPTLILPDGVKSVDVGVFKGCKNLRNLYFTDYKIFKDLDSGETFSGCDNIFVTLKDCKIQE